MAEDKKPEVKKEEPKVEPKPDAAPAEAKKAGPFTVTSDAAATVDYVVKPGKEHRAIVRGNKVLAQSGDVVPLTQQQYANFQDKFWTVDEANAYRAQLEEDIAKRQEAAEAEAAAEEGKKDK